MGMSLFLHLGCHAPIQLSRLELREQLIHSQGIILLRLIYGLELSAQTVRFNKCKSLTTLS
jgi:hypothetical protein